MKKEKPISPPLSTPRNTMPTPNTPPNRPLPLSPDSITQDMSMEDLERYEKFLSIKQALRAENEHQAKVDEALRAREAGIESTKLQMRMAEHNQAMCSHTKESGRSNLAGQKDHTGVVHLICQMCQKAFTGDNVPYSLRPMMEMIGGPNN